MINLPHTPAGIAVIHFTTLCSLVSLFAFGRVISLVDKVGFYRSDHLVNFLFPLASQITFQHVRKSEIHIRILLLQSLALLHDERAVLVPLDHDWLRDFLSSSPVEAEVWTEEFFQAQIFTLVVNGLAHLLILCQDSISLLFTLA